MPADSLSIQDVEDDVRRFVARQCGCSIAAVLLELELARDLGLDGDDADDFMNAFFESFGVNKNGYRFCDYFYPEGWPHWWGWIMRVMGRQPKARLSLRVGDLVAAASSRSWGVQRAVQ